ncbi:MAG: Nif3-like dinuclear metal center hexameric protein [Bacteroidia bacterium]|jgi:dinuclear metal center YbgI/SA1388 family protein|nr:Nif3-like dinuclear metal center hexameric protein [Bacteroidia bacterium]
MKLIKDVIRLLESWAPLSLQEDYDNAGLITGDREAEVSGVLISLDCTPSVIDEAIQKKCNLIIAHHPVIFKGLKKITPVNEIGRSIIKAIKHDIAIYAIHTNLDNVAHGVNLKLAQKLELVAPKILVPKPNIVNKVSVYVPKSHLVQLQQAMFNAGAGQIGNYSECSFYSEGKGTFKGNSLTNAFVGEPDKQHTEAEYKLEVVVPEYSLTQVINQMIAAHPYEEVAYDVVRLNNVHKQVGSGMVGKLTHPMTVEDFLRHVKTKLNLHVIKHTHYGQIIENVAVCGGSGSFLLQDAISSGAEAFITSDFKYHEYFNHQNRLMITDIGHYESEISTIELISEEILKKSPKFAVILTEINTNPITYYI